jgi:branched-chain amino acid transport system substrate-binding protein
LHRGPWVLRRAAVAAAVVSVGSGLAACGGGDDAQGNGKKATGSTLTIYSSVPLQGPSAARSQAVVEGEKLALKESGGRIGPFTIKFVSLDDSTPAKLRWEPGQTAGNARRAVQDQSTIAYLGDLDSGASAISIPLLNEAGILQISPSSTYVGFTRMEGADKGEPEKYYPASPLRTFGRVIPADHVQAVAQADYQKAQGCSRLFVARDQAFGGALAGLVEARAPSRGIEVVAAAGVRSEGVDFTKLAAKIAASGADCMFYAGATENGAVPLFVAVHAAAPRMKLFGGNGVADPTFAQGIGAAVARVTFVTSPAIDPRDYPPAGRAFVRAYRLAYGRSPAPDAAFGYEAMRAALQAIRNAGARGDDRRRVIDGFFAIRRQRSALGAYDIDAQGDTTLTDYGAYGIERGALVFRRVLRAAG